MFFHFYAIEDQKSGELPTIENNFLRYPLKSRSFSFGAFADLDALWEEILGDLQTLGPWKNQRKRRETQNSGQSPASKVPKSKA